MRRAHPSRRDVLALPQPAQPRSSIRVRSSHTIATQPCSDLATAGDLLGTLPLSRAGSPVQPFGVKFGGAGLDARLVTDLSRLQPDQLVTPNALAYIRTECPRAAAERSPWRIKTSGLVTREGTLTLEDLTRVGRHMGRHLFECAGNNNPANFGLMSVADWDGVPLTEVVSTLPLSSRATGVLVSGVDHDAQQSADSIPGASWVFPLASLDQLGAFVAVGMNREPVPLDHGKPVRLVVPGWYGCAWIKWVNEIRLAGRDEPATGQMRSSRGEPTRRRHDLARTTHQPRSIQRLPGAHREATRALCPVPDRRHVWGGTRPVDRLEIRFGTTDAWKPFSICPLPRTHMEWSLWDYRWKPDTAGPYRIALRIPDLTVPQRRLDGGYYVRDVTIDEV